MQFPLSTPSSPTQLEKQSLTKRDIPQNIIKGNFQMKDKENIHIMKLDKNVFGTLGCSFQLGTTIHVSHAI